MDDAGRVLVQDTGAGFNLPGGSPEPGDADLGATVVREAMDRVSGRGHRCGVSGIRAGIARTVGRTGEFRPRHSDPDGGRLFRRLMTSLAEASGLLGWGCSVFAQAQAARQAASSLKAVSASSINRF